MVPDDDDSQVMMFDTQNMDTAEPAQPRRRRRRLVMDRVTEIPHEQLRTNIADTSSLVNRVKKAFILYLFFFFYDQKP